MDTVLFECAVCCGLRVTEDEEHDIVVLNESLFFYCASCTEFTLHSEIE